MLYDTNTSPQVILNVVSHTQDLAFYTSWQAGKRVSDSLKRYISMMAKQTINSVCNQGGIPSVTHPCNLELNLKCRSHFIKLFDQKIIIFKSKWKFIFVDFHCHNLISAWTMHSIVGKHFFHFNFQIKIKFKIVIIKIDHFHCHIWIQHWKMHSNEYKQA